MKNQEQKLKELIENCKKTKGNFLDELQNITFPKNEMYEHLIDVSRKFPEMEELIKFIIFISDVQNTNNEIIKDILKENITTMIENKIKCLETILEMNKILQNKLLTEKQEKEIKQEIKDAVDELPFWKKIVYQIVVIVPKEFLDILKNISNSKLGLIFLVIITIILFVHFLPNESKYVIEKIDHSQTIKKAIK